MTWLYSDQWAAGFFDGEGCISLFRVARGQGNSFDLTVQVTQNAVAPLEALRSRFGGTVSKRRGQHDRCHRWRVQARQAEIFLRRILPNLLVKREQAEIALRVRATVKPAGQRLSEAEIHAREALYESFRRTFAR